GNNRLRARVSQFYSRGALGNQKICSSLNVATTRSGINMDAVRQVGVVLKEAAERTSSEGGIACAKFVCFANSVEDNPFMAGAYHGVGEPEAVINVGVS